MDQNTKEIVSILKNRGQNLFDKPKEEIKYTKVVKADKILNDIERYPHIFVLGCVMDRQIKAERAWLIPYKVSQEIGGLDFNTFLSVSKEDLMSKWQNSSFSQLKESIRNTKKMPLSYGQEIQAVLVLFDGSLSSKV